MQVFHLKCEDNVDPKGVKEGLELLGYEPIVYHGELGGLDVLLPDKQVGNYEMFSFVVRELVGVVGVGKEPALKSTTIYKINTLMQIITRLMRI